MRPQNSLSKLEFPFCLPEVFIIPRVAAIFFCIRSRTKQPDTRGNALWRGPPTAQTSEMQVGRDQRWMVRTVTIWMETGAPATASARIRASK